MWGGWRVHLRRQVRTHHPLLHRLLLPLQLQLLQVLQVLPPL